MRVIKGIIKSYFATWLNIFNFWGRATRKDVIVFVVGSFILFCLVAVISAILDANFGIRHNPYASVSFKIIGFTFLKNMVLKDIIQWIFIITFLTLGIRRMHDTGQVASTWLWYLIPVVGQFYLAFVLFFEPSNYHSEKDGEINPYSNVPYQTKS